MEQEVQRFQNMLLVVGGEDPGGTLLAWIGRYQRLEILRLGRSRHACYGDEAVTFPLTAS
jgi:hypothetical protein